MEAFATVSDKMPKIAYLNPRSLESNSDNSLFNKVKEDNEEAFETLFRKYYPRLCVYARSIIEGSYESEEVVQDVFVKIWEKRVEINVNSSFKSYIYKAVKNNCITYLRDQKNLNSKIRKINDSDESMYTNPDENFEFDIYQKIDEAIDLLPEQCRIIFKMSRMSGLRHKEIAENLGIKVKTVENQIGIALKKLRNIFTAVLLLLSQSIQFF